MPDDPSNGELARNIDRLREDTRDDFSALREQMRGDFAGLREQVASMVSQGQHEADLRTVNQRIDHADTAVNDVRTDARHASDQARQARHVSIATVVAAVGVLVSVIALFRDNSPSVAAGLAAFNALIGLGG